MERKCNLRSVNWRDFNSAPSTNFNEASFMTLLPAPLSLAITLLVHPGMKDTYELGKAFTWFEGVYFYFLGEMALIFHISINGQQITQDITICCFCPKRNSPFCEQCALLGPDGTRTEAPWARHGVITQSAVWSCQKLWIALWGELDFTGGWARNSPTSQMVGWMYWGILGTLWRTNWQYQGKHISSAMEVQSDLDNGIKISNLGTVRKKKTIRDGFIGRKLR